MWIKLNDNNNSVINLDKVYVFTVSAFGLSVKLDSGVDVLHHYETDKSLIDDYDRLIDVLLKNRVYLK